MEVEVQEINSGFYHGAAASLATVRVNKWLREPLGKTTYYYLHDANARFQVGSVTFCGVGKKKLRLQSGQTLLLFVTNTPVDALGSVLHVNPQLIFSKDLLGSDHWQDDPDLHGLKDFEELISLVTRLAVEEPFRLDVFGELLR